MTTKTEKHRDEPVALAVQRAAMADPDIPPNHGISRASPPEKHRHTAEVEALRKALQGMLDRYVGLVESGDAGFWDAEKEKEVIAARAALATQPTPTTAEDAETIETYFARQIEWSRNTFGPALRTGGVLDHIRKELKEIEAEPHDLSEWIDVVILAMDGFWRHGGTASDLLPRLLSKQRKNMARQWPDWRAMSEDSAIEHDRSQDAIRTPTEGR